MRHSEWIATAYFIYLTGASWFVPVPMRRRMVVLAVAAAALLLIRAGTTDAFAALRDWLPGIYILGGYYASAALFVAPSATLEAWLIGWDRRLLGDPATRFVRWPRLLLAYLDIVYMFCFVLVPAGCLVLLAAGRADLVDRYWTIVVGAELGSFAPLAFIQTRPPWVVERKAVAANRTVHRLAARMVKTFTICVNTFPSGHVAGSLGVALGLIEALPLAGAVFLFLAASIALACVVGRYHYVVDTVAGAALALALFVAVSYLKI
jgi:membrane-associated phospholipid phosphatase